MEQYIKKSALLAEIDKRIRACGNCYVLDELASLYSSINNLETKEADLEKEIKEYINDEWCDEWSGDVGNWIRCRRGTTPMEVEDVKDIAKHFFELGMAISNKTQERE